jgi:Holliday junction resolvase RusA-like endonuclease
VVRLSRQSEERDALNVLAADRRELALNVCTERPLRKPRNPKQGKTVQRLRAQAAEQIAEQLDSSARRAFRGRVAIELRLSVANEPITPALATMVKDYVDLLVGPVVVDDSRVDHLMVLREPSDGERAEATLRCIPLSIFAAEYDRAFRILGDGGAIAAVTPNPEEFPDARYVNAAPNPSYRWGFSHFGSFEQERLRSDEAVLDLLNRLDDDEEQQLAEDPDAWVDLDLPPGYDEFADRDTRDSVRLELEKSVAFGRGDWMTDQGFDARDRPGPAAAWLDETVELDLADVVSLPDAGPGCFLLPPPPERETPTRESSWEQHAASLIASQALHGPWRGARFRGHVVLDVALRGTGGRRNDVDNVAHKVLRAMRLAFGGDIPPLMGYRVYRRIWPANDVRVRLMPKIRLEALARAMDEARRVARNERAERARE